MKYNLVKKRFGGLLISNEDISYESRRNKLIFSNEEDSMVVNIDGRLEPKLIEGFVKKIEHIAFELTGLCNLNCAYCAYGKYYNITDGDRKGRISWATIQKALDFVLLKKSSNSSLHISFYGGEPLLEIDLIKKTVDYCNKYTKKNITFTYGMTTNGVLLNKNIAFLINNDFKINISLDGDESANSFRVFQNGTESYSALIREILKIRMNHPIFFKNNINFLSVLHKQNSKLEIISYFKETFDKTPQISRVSQTNLSTLFEDDFYETICARDFTEEFIDCSENENPNNIEFDPYIQQVITIISNFSTFKYDNYNSVLYQVDFDPEKSLIPTATCLPFSKKIFITTDGFILPCERINYKHVLGKINDNNVELNSKKIADYYNIMYDKFKPICLKCAYVQNCQVCLMYLEMNDGAYCPYFASDEDADQVYQNIFSHCEKNPELLKKVIYEFSIDN